MLSDPPAWRSDRFRPTLPIRGAGVAAQESPAVVGGAFPNAPDGIRTCDLRLRRYAKASTGSVPGIVPPMPFVWIVVPRRGRRFPGLVGMWRACSLAHWNRT